MVIYEYELKWKGDITISEYNVRETEKMYILENRMGYFGINTSTRIPKDWVDTDAQKPSYVERRYFYSTCKDDEKARKAFINYIQNVDIPKKQKSVDEAIRNLDASKEVLALLESQEKKLHEVIYYTVETESGCEVLKEFDTKMDAEKWVCKQDFSEFAEKVYIRGFKQLRDKDEDCLEENMIYEKEITKRG